MTRCLHCGMEVRFDPFSLLWFDGNGTEAIDYTCADNPDGHVPPEPPC